VNARRKVSFIGAAGIVLAGIALTGCAASRTVMIAPVEAESKSMVPPLPLSVRVELKGVTQEDPNPITPVSVDKDSLKKMITTYLATRNTFQRLLDDLSDSVLNVDVKYRLRTGNIFEYTVSAKASLVSRDGLDLGRFSGQGTAKGGATRFTADADSAPMNKAMVDAMEELCQKIEENRPLILVKLGGAVSAPRAESPRIGSDIDDPRVLKSKLNKNSYAIVVGIEQYRQKLPKADFAVSDAQAMTGYLTKVLGYPEENVVTLTNDHAALGDFVKYFEKWLPNNVEQGSRVFVYYSGHGAPNAKTGDAYLVPYDGDPSFIDQTGYPLRRMYDALGKLPAKEIVVALDSCFSGAGGRSVLAEGARPLVMNLQRSLPLSKNITVLAASSNDQISSTYKEQGHGLFTYFLLKGIKDESVVRQDGSLAVGDLFGYLKPQVERIARKQYNNEQTPQLISPR
jgi:hypothetical protein